MIMSVIFNTSKNEIFQISENYKTVYRKMKTTWKVDTNQSNINVDLLAKTKIFILAGSQDQFSTEELKCLKTYVDNGGVLMVLLGEGGELEFNTNINFLLEEYGMTINNDSVVRTQYYKNFHPKECIIGGGIICDTMRQSFLKEKNGLIPFEFDDEKLKMQFVYPYGATLNISNPSKVLITTGIVAYPFNRPIVGYFCNENSGKILTVGSGNMFQDKYITEELNMAIWDFFWKILTDNDFKLNLHDFGDSDINENKLVPDTIFLAEQSKMCLLESLDCNIPDDFKKMYEMKLFAINNDQFCTVVDLYKQLDTKFEPLKIIKPQFEIPLPPLRLAVFQPIFSDIEAPALELFNLDEAFSSERAQLSQLTNKTISSVQNSDKKGEKELEYFIMECGRIVDIYDARQKSLSAKDILFEVCLKLVKYKKLDRD